MAVRGRTAVPTVLFGVMVAILFVQIGDNRANNSIFKRLHGRSVLKIVERSFSGSYVVGDIGGHRRINWLGESEASGDIIRHRKFTRRVIAYSSKVLFDPHTIP